MCSLPDRGAIVLLAMVLFAAPIGAASPTMEAVPAVEPAPVGSAAWPAASARAGWLRQALADEAARLAGACAPLLKAQRAAAPRRSWIGRHPILAGAALGFGGGFLVGYVGGDDGVFYDFTSGFNGVLVGAIGAGAGAAVGAVADALR